MVEATLLALTAALLHATWNLIVKTSGDRELTAWGQYAAGGVLFLPLAFVLGVPGWRAWPFLIASAAVHVLYVEGLVRAYHHGDFSFAYPLARGGGAMVAAVVGAIALGDGLPVAAWVALVVVGVGLASLVRRTTTKASIVWAAMTAAVIGSYTVIDTAGSRHSSNGIAYGVMLTFAAAVGVTIAGVARGRLREFIGSWRANARQYVVAGVCMTAAYSLVLVAVRIHGVSVGYVATLRESAVVIGALAGWLLLGERLGRGRVASSVVVLAGMIGLVVVH